MSSAVDVMREVLRVRGSHNEHCGCPVCGEGMTRMIAKLEMNEMPRDPTPAPPSVGLKFDAKKDPWDLFPWQAATAVVRVLAYGAKKYGRWNWLKVEPFRERYFAAAMRHMVAYWAGEWIDSDSGEPHLACAICSLMFLLSKGPGSDADAKTAP